MVKIFDGLFNYKGRYFLNNIKDVPHAIKRVAHTLKYGYPPQAKWETFQWFIEVLKELLINYRDNRCGTQIIIDNYTDDKEEENYNAYNDLLNHMVDLLNLMDENNPIYDGEIIEEWNKEAEMRENAKNEFFTLFSKYFYGFWD